MIAHRTEGRLRRHRRLRKRVMGLPERLRMSVYRSHKHLYVQLINDMSNTTVLGYSTKAAAQKGAVQRGGNVTAAEKLGELVAKEAIKRGITRVVFDRGGYQYHGRVKALAESARKAGLEF